MKPNPTRYILMTAILYFTCLICGIVGIVTHDHNVKTICTALILLVGALWSISLWIDDSDGYINERNNQIALRQYKRRNK